MKKLKVHVRNMGTTGNVYLVRRVGILTTLVENVQFALVIT